ncbi:hypothetical protein K523DRAFT_88369 [Schizophyllum commune Tattone D]|nr:hypothetical protein K523DRAFT_88369 [Schizophyllum commune Tattone D]
MSSVEGEVFEDKNGAPRAGATDKQGQTPSERYRVTLVTPSPVVVACRSAVLIFRRHSLSPSSPPASLASDVCARIAAAHSAQPYSLRPL